MRTATALKIYQHNGYNADKNPSPSIERCTDARCELWHRVKWSRKEEGARYINVSSKENSKIRVQTQHFLGMPIIYIFYYLQQ
jgi:hypothetical protein